MSENLPAATLNLFAHQLSSLSVISLPKRFQQGAFSSAGVLCNFGSQDKWVFAVRIEDLTNRLVFSRNLCQERIACGFNQ